MNIKKKCLIALFSIALIALNVLAFSSYAVQKPEVVKAAKSVKSCYQMVGYCKHALTYECSQMKTLNQCLFYACESCGFQEVVTSADK